MDWKVLSTVFGSVFIAELGDKTQLATLLFASDKDVSKLTVFLGAAAALIVTSAIGVAADSVMSQYVSEESVALSGGHWVHRYRHMDAIQSLNEESP
jgi:putative Ca2+/H+ antiporter (TMEM165/GDT1 family)